MNQKGFAHLLPILLVAIVGIAVAAFLITSGNLVFKQTDVPTPISNTSSSTNNWQTYTDSEIGDTLKYPNNIIPSAGNCDTFVISANDVEKERILKIKSSGIEIAYTVNGSEFAFCIMGNTQNLELLTFAEGHTPTANFQKTKFGAYDAFMQENERFSEYFLLTPDNRILRLWVKHNNPQTKKVTNQILSTFEFTE